MERTDTQKLNREPIKVVLGNKEYTISPKPIFVSRKWKQKALPVVEKFEGLFKIDLSNNAETIPAIKEFIFIVTDELIDLVFDWETDLPKDLIMNSATEEELLEAAIVVIGLAFPLVQRLGVLNKLTNLQSMN